jgi:hypothetical protein
MTVTVFFEGICTHVRRDPFVTPWLPVRHRVVLANARGPGYEIPDHVGTLHIAERHVVGKPQRRSYLVAAPGQEYTWEIHGATLTIPTKDRLRDLQRQCMPPMPDAPGFGVSPDYVLVENVTAEKVDAFFDITGGTLRGCCIGEAYGSTLTLTRTGPQPVLEIRPFDRKKRPLSIHLTPDAVVVIRHMTREEVCPNDDRRHFVLHYLIGGQVPDPDTVPLDKLVPCKGCKPCRKGERRSLGVGCSASGYP